MKKYTPLIISAVLFILFAIFTILVCKVDVQAIGPNGSSVGFATFNKACHEAIGENLTLYNITDWASVITIPIGLVFTIVGIVEWVRRKNILKVDGNILALGIFYILTFAAYAIFEFVVINRRPVLIDGVLEASYPSSTTMLSLTVFVTAIDQIFIYIQSKRVRAYSTCFIATFCLFLILGRVVSGVHWMSDIIAAIILSGALIAAYFGIKNLFKKEEIAPAE